jgi:hypothetical protein
MVQVRHCGGSYRDGGGWGESAAVASSALR